jgi:hypothetical protein
VVSSSKKSAAEVNQTKDIQKEKLNQAMANSSGIVAKRHDPSLTETASTGEGGEAGGDAGPGTTFVDNGGVILTRVNLQLIFWGSAWSRSPTPSDIQIENAVTSILSGTYMSALAQYRGIEKGRYRGKVVVTSSDPPNPFSDQDIRNLVINLINNRTVPKPSEDSQILYCVVVPVGVNNSASGFIGEHTTLTYNDAGTNTIGHFAWVTNNGTLDYVTKIFSHELVESCTDPEGSAILGVTGTCSQSGWCEIGDVCNSAGRLDGVLVQSYWSQSDHACIVPQALQIPQTGVQFHGTVQAKQTKKWFTYNWPAHWHVIWTVVPTSPKSGNPQIKWRVQVERSSYSYITYWISITNLTSSSVDIEARYEVLAR